MPWLGLIEQLDVILRGKFNPPKVFNATEVLHNITPDILHLIQVHRINSNIFISVICFFLLCSSSLSYCVIVSLLLLTANQNRGPQ